MKIIGIAGGSGSGKSTVSYALVDSDPANFEVINLDDYQRLKSEPNLPMLSGMINWDHPDIINWDKLLADIKRLQDGQAATINVWAHRSNPDYDKHGKMIPRTIQPKPIIIVEGTFALYDPRLYELFSKKYYLDLDQITRNSRRDKGKVIDQVGYETKVLAPMFKQYMKPTKQNADTIINVSGMNVNQVTELIRDSLQALPT